MSNNTNLVLSSQAPVAEMSNARRISSQWLWLGEGDVKRTVGSLAGG
jgi:hypothetical protein